jgi:type VI secretion system protein ImpH
MTVAFMGLTGPSGALPRHYTEFLLRHQKEADDAEKFALRDWFDLFNHRLISLFFRAWEKYRFYVPYERGEYRRPEPDPYTLCLFSLIGLGMPALRQRLRVSLAEEDDEHRREHVLAEIKDLALVHYSGHLSHQVRTALGLEAVLRDYFQFPVEVEQFRGQWLRLDLANQSCMSEGSRTCELGVNLVAGDRVWDVQGKFRVRIGPLSYTQFTSLIPDCAPVLEQKTFFLLAHLIRLYVGPDLDFDVQLVLRAVDIPQCRMEESPTFSPRLGWNTWIANEPFKCAAEDSVFEGETVRWLNASDSFHTD